MATGSHGCGLSTSDFSSAASWKAEAEVWKARYESARVELDEFTANSSELEQELEKELHLSLQQNKRLQHDLRVSLEEITMLKESSKRSALQIASLQTQLQDADARKNSTAVRLRQVEQENDNLETANRNLAASISSYLGQIEELTESKTIVEVELDQTRLHEEKEQRLQDEIKDHHREARLGPRAWMDLYGRLTQPLEPESDSDDTSSENDLDLAVIVTVPHDHPAEKAQVDKSDAMAKIKQLAVQSSEPPRVLITRDLKDELAAVRKRLGLNSANQEMTSSPSNGHTRCATATSNADNEIMRLRLLADGDFDAADQLSAAYRDEAETNLRHALASDNSAAFQVLIDKFKVMDFSLTADYTSAAAGKKCGGQTMWS